jgi:hypothetical protein
MKALRNKITLFILPLLDIVKSTIIQNGFENSYLDFNEDFQIYKVMLVYTKRNKALELHVDNSKVYKGKYIYTFDVYSLVPTIDLIMRGKYSQIHSSDKYKILTFWNLNRRSKLYAVLNPHLYSVGKTDLVRQRLELIDKPKPEKVIYKYFNDE